jgi:hypothetical protein
MLSRRAGPHTIVALKKEVAMPSGNTKAPTTAEIRAWAWEQGYEIGDRGPLPWDVLEAWNNSHRTRKAATR